MTRAVREYLQLVDLYCIAFHNTRFSHAGTVLDNPNVEQLASDIANWERVIRKLSTRKPRTWT